MDAEVGYAIGLRSTLLQRLMRSAVEDVVAGVGLTPSEHGALELLAREPGATSADLARFLLVTPQVAGRLVADLHGRGLRRARAVRREVEAATRAVLADLDDTEARCLADLLGRVVNGANHPRPLPTPPAPTTKEHR